jgi:hypothetical protein
MRRSPPCANAGQDDAAVGADDRQVNGVRPDVEYAQSHAMTPPNYLNLSLNAGRCMVDLRGQGEMGEMFMAAPRLGRTTASRALAVGCRGSSPTLIDDRSTSILPAAAWRVRGGTACERLDHP